MSIDSKIVSLVSGTDSLTLDHLRDVSAPSVMLNQSVIQYIRRLKPVDQSIYISKIAQIIATARVKDKAQLALELLESGSAVPAIFVNHAAQDDLQAAIKKLNEQLTQILFNIKINQVVSDPISSLINKIQLSQAQATAVQAANKGDLTMTNGAIQKQ